MLIRLSVYDSTMATKNNKFSVLNLFVMTLCALVSFFYLFSYAWYPVVSFHGLIDLSIGILILSRVFLKNFRWKIFCIFPVYLLASIDAFYHVSIVDAGVYSLSMAIGFSALILLLLDSCIVRDRVI